MVLRFASLTSRTDSGDALQELAPEVRRAQNIDEKVDRVVQLGHKERDDANIEKPHIFYAATVMEEGKEKKSLGNVEINRNAVPIQEFRTLLFP